MNIKFDSVRDSLGMSFENGVDLKRKEELVFNIRALEKTYANKSSAYIKAKTIEYLIDNCEMYIEENDIFQCIFSGWNIMVEQRWYRQNDIINQEMAEEVCDRNLARDAYGSYSVNGDYGHTSPNSRLLLNMGFAGLLKRCECEIKKEGLSEKQTDFYNSCIITLNAVIKGLKRLAKATGVNKCNAQALYNIAENPPQNIYEAMQLLVYYYFIHNNIMGTGVRTLGRLDVLLQPFYENDIKNGTFTKEEITEILKFFLYKFWKARIPFDLPFCLGGADMHGNSSVNEMSYLIVSTYNDLNIHSPKIHIRVCDKTPVDFIKLVLSCIRGGNSSFVFVNDNVGIKSLVDVGINKKDAWDYVPIGCYEPAVWGVEMGCTGNGGVNLAKAVELCFTNGRDLKSGDLCGVQTGEIKTFDEFVCAVKKQVEYFTNKAVRFITEIEKRYERINPDPFLSCQYEHSVKCGVDVYEGGAKYNNSSLYFYCIASLTDSVCAVKRLVFEEKRVTFCELEGILKNNWSGNEELQQYAKSISEKYGNNNPVSDGIAAELSHFCAELVNNKPNGRGGVFKAALFSIDQCFDLGKKTMATPDGRNAGDMLSKNLCASVGMDKNGITSLINSVTKIDHSKFPTGSVLDVVLHPSAVSENNGLNAFYSILKTYFDNGGFAMHGNVFNAEDLKKAQKEPEKYKNLQVRLCGWNAFFVDLTKQQQDSFIIQAKK